MVTIDRFETRKINCIFVRLNLTTKIIIMKKGLLLFIVAGLGFGACDQIEEIENFAVDHKFEKTVVLDISETDPDMFYEDFSFETTDDKDFRDNLSKISNYSVKTLSYRVSDFAGADDISAMGLVQFMNETNNIGDPIDLGKINFLDLKNSGTEIEIPISDELKTLIQNQLLENDMIKMRVGALVSGKPFTAEMVLALEIEALVKAN